MKTWTITYRREQICEVLVAVPDDWTAEQVLVRAVRERSGGRCECLGECGLHRWHPPEPRRCVEVNGQPAVWARGMVVLTTAHLNAAGGPCRCEPLCADPDHLRAMCQRCHLRYDAPRHAKHARATTARKRGAGTFPLFEEDESK